MNIELIFAFLGASILLALLPGPDLIYVLTESISRGHKRGIAIAIGLVSGVFVHTFAAATGISLLLQQSPFAFQIVQYAGALYLLYLAYRASQEKALALKLDSSTTKSEENYTQLIRKGFIMNVLNPKVSLFFIALLPQFVNPNGIAISIQMIILGLLFIFQSLSVFIILALLVGRFAPYLNQSRFWKITKWIKVVVFILLAVGMIFLD